MFAPAGINLALTSIPSRVTWVVRISLFQAPRQWGIMGSGRGKKSREKSWSLEQAKFESSFEPKIRGEGVREERGDYNSVVYPCIDQSGQRKKRSKGGTGEIEVNTLIEERSLEQR